MANDQRNTESGWYSGHARLLVGVVAGAVLVFGVALYWFAVPRIADSLLRDRLASVEKRADLQADFSRIETSALEGVTLHGFRLQRNNAKQPFVSIEKLETTLKLYPLLFGNPKLERVGVTEASLTIRRRADGSTNLQRIREKLRGSDSPGETNADTDSANETPGFLRYFGGQWPDVHVAGAELRLESSPDAPGWPVSRLATDRFQLGSSGQSAQVDGVLNVQPGPGAHEDWSIPRKVTVDGILRIPLADSTGTFDFAEPLEVVGFDPAPFVRIGVGQVGVSEEHTLEARRLSFGLQHGGAPNSVGSADRIAASFDGWPTSPADIALDEVVVEKPNVVTSVDRQHGSSFHDLLQLLRAPRADHVRARARHVARRMYLDIPEWKRPELKGENNTESSESEDAGPTAKLRRFVTETVVSAAIPDRVEIRNAGVHLTDRRRMGLVDPAPELGLRNGRFVFRHAPEQGQIDIEAGFAAYAGESQSRGTLSAELQGSYRQGTLETDAELESLDLSWVSQMLGVQLARHVKGGTLNGKLETSRDGDGGRHPFSGFIALENGVFELESVAEDPIDQLDAGYYFEGHYDTDDEMPEPKHIARKDLRPDDAPALDDVEQPDTGTSEADADAGSNETEVPLELPTEGEFVFTSGEARLNGVTAEVRPALYGLRSFERMPTRLDAEVELPETKVQQLFDAVPRAIRGPTDGTRMRGTFAWSFDVEIPLHDAGEMEWKTEPKLTDFELVELPEAVDVRKLREGFTHVIRDERLEFERTVQIPPMRPVKTNWIIENGLPNSDEVDLETLDERRRDRGWPPLPRESAFSQEELAELRTAARQRNDLGRSPSPLDAPEVWTTDTVESLAAPTPWFEGEPLANVAPDDIPEDRRPVRWARDKIEQAQPDPSRVERGTILFDDRAAKPGRAAATEVVTDDNAANDSAAATNSTLAGPWNSPGRGTGEDADRQPGSDESASAPALDRSIIVKGEGREKLHPYGSYVFVPLHHVSKWLPRAIMTTEDNSFFEHNGFNWFALEESVEDNIQAGGFARGGSTVSMQLVKNVFLTFDKVLARKIREAFLVWLMEDVVDVPKARIMELYFNIIEFGPGIFGIHDASVHYFGERPDELTLSEVLWLVSIVPNPKKHHKYYERGEVSDAWFDNLVSYAEIMHDRNRASKEDIEDVENNRPEFYKPDRGEPKLRPEDSASPTLDDFSTIFE
jgi:hypothetical protein